MADGIQAIVAGIVAREGGFVEHPDDPGGATKYGIARATLTAWRGREASIDDVRALGVAEAMEIYTRDYFEGPGFDRLPARLQEIVTDTGVLFGPRDAGRVLQRGLVLLGYEVGEIDGIVGSRTRAAAAIASEEPLLRAILLERVALHVDRCRQAPRLTAFLRGWLARALEVAR